MSGCPKTHEVVKRGRRAGSGCFRSTHQFPGVVAGTFWDIDSSELPGAVATILDSVKTHQAKIFHLGDTQLVFVLPCTGLLIQADDD